MDALWLGPSDLDSLAPQFFDDGRIEKNRGRYLPGLRAHDDRSFAPGNVMAQVPRFEFLQLCVFIPSPGCLPHKTSARPLAQPALAVTCSLTRVFFCRAFTMPKKFSVLGLPCGASIRCTLLLGFLISAANSSTPTVSLTRSRRMALPATVSPPRYALIASVKSASRKRGSRCARAATVALKSRVRAMLPPSPIVT